MSKRASPAARARLSDTSGGHSLRRHRLRSPHLVRFSARRPRPHPFSLLLRMSSRASIHDDSRFQPPFILNFLRDSTESIRFACQFCPLRKETSGRIAAMKRRTLLQSLPAITLLPAAEWLASAQDKPGSATSTTTVYELRVYHAYEGKLDDLRSEEHTSELQSQSNLVCRLL